MTTHLPAAAFAANPADRAAEADRLFDAGRIAEAARAYETWIAAHGACPHATIRLADCAVRSGAPQAALAHLATIAPDDCGWADHVRAAALLALGEADAALALARRLVAARPEEPGFVRQLFAALHAAGREIEIAPALPLLDALPPADALGIRLTLALMRRAHGEIAALYCAQHDLHGAAIDEPAAAALAALAARLTPAQVVRTIADFARRAHHGPLVWDALVRAALGAGDAAQASALLDAAEAEHGPRMAATRLDLLCETGRIAEAAALLDDPGLAAHWRDASIDARVAVLAEMGEWARIVALVVPFLQDGPARVLQPATRHTVVAAVRQTRAHDSVCRMIDANPVRDGDLARLRAMLETDHAFAALCHDTALPVAPLPARIAAFARPLVPSATAGGTVLICTDARYLAGAAVTVSSLLRGNAGVLAADAVTICLADDVDQTGAEALQRIIEAHGLLPTTLREHAIMAQTGALRSRYGHFGPGDRLARAAYFRLFAMRHLLDRGLRGRVLYCDSDTVIEPGIEVLLAIDMAGQPLAARAENAADRHIARARARLGLVQAYVNSGVLLFDADHPALADRIAAAIAIARDAPERLSFHDQCAINAAFDGATALLPDRCNAFIRARDTVPPRDVLVWHYLDRPKPWDPLYPGAAAHRWLTEWAALGAALAPEALRHMLRLSRGAA